MRVSQIIRSIKTQPQEWVLNHDNDILMSFTYKGFTFGKLNKEYGGSIKLVNKKAGVEMVWDANDAVGLQLWSSVIMHYVNTHIVNK